jgi:hypothetical protein
MQLSSVKVSTPARRRIQLLSAVAMILAIIFSGLHYTPSQAAARTLTWSDAGNFPAPANSTILNIKFDNGIFLAVASNGDVFNSSNGVNWNPVGTLNGQTSGPTPPSHDYKSDLAFGLSGTPASGDSGVAGTPTWVFTSKDNGTAWTSNDNGATWRVTLTDAGYLKKVAYGDGHFLLGGQGFFKTSTNGVNWQDAGNSAISGDSNGKITFGNHTFLIPITYSNKVCRRSSINWVNDSTFDCSATFPGAPVDGVAGNYWTNATFGNGIFVSGLNGGSSKDFWTSSDTGATWTRGFSTTTGPASVTFGGGVFVMDKSGGTTAFSSDGLTWTETGSRPGGGSGLIAFGNGRFIGLGGSGNSVISSGLLSTVEPSSPAGLVGVAGNAKVDLTWNASTDDGGAAVTYTVTSTPGSLTCITTLTSCQIAGLTNETGYTFTVTATNLVGSSADSAATPQLTPRQPVPNSPTGLVGTAGTQLIDFTWTAPADNGGGAVVSYTVTSTPGSATCTSTTTGCRIEGLTNGTSYIFTVTASNAAGPSEPSAPTAGLTPAVPGPSISVGSTPNSQLATIPAGLTAAAIPATADLPMVSLSFAATSGSATATVAPIENPAAASATPFAITGTTKIVDIQVTGVTGPVTVCLDGASTDDLFHFTGGAWVALPQRTYANGQVCGVTESFSPFAAAEAVALPSVSRYTGPLVSGRLPRVASTSGDSLVAITGDRMAQVTSVSLEGKLLTIVSKSESQIVVKTPAHSAGFVDLVLTSESGSLTFQDAFEYRAPVVDRVPLIRSKSVLISSASAKSLSVSQRKTVGSFVASAKAGAVLKCAATYVSKKDAATAKALATAACASAKKSNAGIATRVTAPMLVKAKSPRRVLLSLTN